MSKTMLNSTNVIHNLENRKSLVMGSYWEIFSLELKNFFDFLKKHTITTSILDELEIIIKNNDMSSYNLGGRGLGREFPNLPNDEEVRIAFYYHMLKEIAKDREKGLDIMINTPFSNDSMELEKITQGIKEQIFIPFYIFINHKISGGDSLLYLLYRFKLSSEGFQKEHLFNIYKENQKREEVLDKELRKFLFDQGFDYSFSKPRTASGEPDVVVHVQGNPLPLEVKVFDPERRYGKSRIIDGFNQAYRYMEDYNSHLGYLVIFNPSDTYLNIDSNNKSPSLRVGGKEIFAIIVDINPNRPTASKEKTPNRVSIKQEDIDGQHPFPA